MVSLVNFNRPTMTKRLVTVCALEGFFSSVDSLVLSQVTSLVEVFATVFAAEYFLASLDIFMQFQIVGLGEIFSTKFTLKLFFSSVDLLGLSLLNRLACDSKNV